MASVSVIRRLVRLSPCVMPSRENTLLLNPVSVAMSNAVVQRPRAVAAGVLDQQRDRLLLDRDLGARRGLEHLRRGDLDARNRAGHASGSAGSSSCSPRRRSETTRRRERRASPWYRDITFTRKLLERTRRSTQICAVRAYRFEESRTLRELFYDAAFLKTSYQGLIWRSTEVIGRFVRSPTRSRGAPGSHGHGAGSRKRNTRR